LLCSYPRNKLPNPNSDLTRKKLRSKGKITPPLSRAARRGKKLINDPWQSVATVEQDLKLLRDIPDRI
jgi:hypothetical protein